MATTHPTVNPGDHDRRDPFAAAARAFLATVVLLVIARGLFAVAA